MSSFEATSVGVPITITGPDEPDLLRVEVDHPEFGQRWHVPKERFGENCECWRDSW